MHGNKYKCVVNVKGQNDHSTVSQINLVTKPSGTRKMSMEPLAKFWYMKLEKDTSDKKKINSVAFSLQANYTDRATAACRRS
jgi:hypothetical protein